MSTTWYYQCESHDPPLAESFDSGPSRTEMEKDLDPERRSVINELPDFVMENLYDSELRHWWWLRRHKTCKVALVNEYDESIDQWNEKQRIADAQRLGLCPMPKCKLKLNHDGPCKP